MHQASAIFRLGMRSLGVLAMSAGLVFAAGPAIGQATGAESCQGWPSWVWGLALFAYFAIFLWRTFGSLAYQAVKREVRWKWEAVLVIAALFFWYYFDYCREYVWFIVSAIIGGPIIYLYYLNLLHEKMHNGHHEGDQGEGEEHYLEQHERGEREEKKEDEEKVWEDSGNGD